MHRLDRAGTEIWRILATAAPASVDVESICGALATARPTNSVAVDPGDVELFLCDLELAGLVQSSSPGSSGDASSPERDDRRGPSAAPRVRPHQRLLTGAWELVDEIAPAPRCLARRVGAGFLLRAPDGELSLVAGDAAPVWDSLSSRPSTYVELLDLLCDLRGLDREAAASMLASLVLGWHDHGLIGGLERVDRLHRRLGSPESADSGSVPSSGLRPLGRLEPTGRSAALPSPTRLGSPPVLQDVAGSPEHVAIVCQYGIQDLAPGVEPYTQRCIARLRRLDPDLIVLAGGGRHGRSELREAESVIDRYRALLPDRALWVEKHSATTWENLQWSLEMLQARAIAPRRISFLGDRARSEKLRMACFIARQRFAFFRGTAFRVVPVTRPRFTWRDSRTVQVVVGSAQVLKESRDRRFVTGAPA